MTMRMRDVLHARCRLERCPAPCLGGGGVAEAVRQLGGRGEDEKRIGEGSYDTCVG